MTWLELRWGNSAATRLSLRLISLVYAGMFLVAILLGVYSVLAYLHAHPAHAWILVGSIITGLSIQFIAVLAGFLPTTTKGRAPAAMYAVMRYRIDTQLRQRQGKASEYARMPRLLAHE